MKGSENMSSEEKVKKDNFLVLTVKGFIMGIGNVIPGVSGGTLALILGVYEKLIKSVSHLFDNFKNSFKFLLPVLLGIVIAFLSMSHVVTFCLENYLFATIMLFFGAVLGGLPMLFKKVKHEKTKAGDIIILLITAAVVFLLLFAGEGSSASFAKLTVGKVILLFITGALASATMVVPGVSGSAFLMTIGYYYPLMVYVKNLTKAGADKGHAVATLVPFGIGILFGIFAITKLIEYLLKNHETKTYWGIIGFVIASAAVIILQNFFMANGAMISPAVTLAGTSVVEYVIGVAISALGFVGTYKFGE